MTAESVSGRSVSWRKSRSVIKLTKGKNFARGAGILMPITSLPSEYGIGTLGNEAFRFVDLLGELRQKYWQVLPVGPTSFGDSPYQSFSAFAGNPYMIDLDECAKAGLLTKEEIRSYSWGENETDVDYASLFLNRYKILHTAFERFDANAPGYRNFCTEQSYWLDDFSMYMALKEANGNKGWYEWNDGLKYRKKQYIDKAKKELKREIEFCCFCQYEFFRQWKDLKTYANKRGIEIIGDIPLYVAYDSADVWAEPEQFLLNGHNEMESVAGCPPDAFSDDGQKWGNPLYNWEKMNADGFSWWKKRMQANAGLFDVIRIDHFIGLVRYYTIPAHDPDGRNGKWMRGPGRELTDVIESAVGSTKIIAEDLGVFVPGVKKLIEKTGWPGMKVLIFAFDGNPDHEYLPHNYNDTNMVVYAGTHDNETIMGYFGAKSDYELAYLYEYLNIKSKNEIPDAMLRMAYSSIADVVIFQMQDILGLGNEARMNLPSTIGINWRWRMKKEAVTEKRKEFVRTLSMIYNR